MIASNRSIGQLRRVLVLIDLLAPLRVGRTRKEIKEDLQFRLGESICERTLYRDLLLLESLGTLIVEYSGGPKPNQFGKKIYRLNQRLSASLQCAAIGMED